MREEKRRFQNGFSFPKPFFFFFLLDEISAISSVFAGVLEDAALDVPPLLSS